MLPLHTLSTLVGIFVAGATSGATGIAFPLIAGPIFLMSFRPAEAVALTALCSLSGQIFSIGLLRRKIAYEYRLRLILPGLLGVPLGSALLAHSSAPVIRLGLGFLIVLAGVWGLLQPTRRPERLPRGICESLVGAVGGVTAGLVGVSAVAPAVWCAWCGLGKERQRAIMQPFILTMQATSFAALASAGAIDGALPRDFMLMLLPVLSGVGIGVLCFHAFSSATVTRGVLALVTASGLGLLLV